MVRICSAGDQLSGGKRLASACNRNDHMVPTLQHIKADAAQLINVRMEDLGEKSDLGRGHRIVVGEEEFELEDAAFVH